MITVVLCDQSDTTYAVKPRMNLIGIYMQNFFLK